MNHLALPQLNIRSALARERTAALTRETGMTTTQEGLRAHVAPTPEPSERNLVRKGLLLVRKASGRSITLAGANEALEQARMASK